MFPSNEQDEQYDQIPMPPPIPNMLPNVLRPLSTHIKPTKNLQKIGKINNMDLITDINFCKSHKADTNLNQYQIINQTILRKEGPIYGVKNYEKQNYVKVSNLENESEYNFGDKINNILLNGLGDYIINAWNTHCQIVIDPSVIMHAILSVFGEYIDKHNIQGIFSGESKQIEIIIEHHNFNTFPYKTFLDSVNNLLTPTAKNALTGINDFIINKSTHNLNTIAAAIGSQLLGVMKKDFSYGMTLCGFTGILFDKEDQLWNNVIQTLNGIPTLIPDLKQYCDSVIKIINRWLHDDFSHELFNVPQCESGHSPTVTGDLAFIITGKKKPDKQAFESNNCFGVVEWHGIIPNQPTQYFIGISGITGCDIRKIKINTNEYSIIVPVWSFTAYKNINENTSNSNKIPIPPPLPSSNSNKIPIPPPLQNNNISSESEEQLFERLKKIYERVQNLEKK